MYLVNLHFVKPVHMGSSIAPSSLQVAREQVNLLSDLCGKMNVKSESGAEYFLSFIDDKTRYVWIYVLHRKDQVFE